MGYMIWQAIKKTAIDVWDEILFLIFFNIIWLAGSLLILPLPFVTFALLAVVYDIGQSKGIHFSTFFRHGWRALKQAYIWGGINLGVFILLWVNYRFYGGIEASWGPSAQAVIIGVIVIWSILQLIALAMYPRMSAPGFKLAMRNAAVVMARYPLVILTLLGVIVLIGVISFFFLPMLLVSFSLIALLTNRLVEAMISRELKRETKG